MKLLKICYGDLKYSAKRVGDNIEVSIGVGERKPVKGLHNIKDFHIMIRNTMMYEEFKAIIDSWYFLIIDKGPRSVVQ